MLYKLIVYHTKILISESLDDTQKLFHLRKRPKILLAQNYEQAVLYFDKYKKISKSRSLYIRAFLINQGISHNRIKIETNEENVTKNWKNEVILNFIGV